MTRRHQKRAGFTLIELLVVIGIIITLISLLMAAFSAVRTRQQEKATDDIVFKLQEGIENQRKEIVAQAAKERRERSASFVSLVSYCDNDEDRAQALLVYLKLRHVFPQTFEEAQRAVAIPGVINLGRHVAYATVPAGATTGPQPEYEAGALLYMGLSNLATGGATFATDDATAGNQADITINIMVNTTATAFPSRVFKDARGNPIGIRRFWQAAELNAAPYTNVKPGASLDMFDPLGKLATVTTVWAGGATGRKTIAERVVFVSASQSFDSFQNNKSITAYSFGQDKVPVSVDDVFGYRLLKLGNRGSAQ